MTGITVSQGVQCILEVKVEFFFILYAIYSTVLEILLQVISLDKLFFQFKSRNIVYENLHKGNNKITEHRAIF